MYTCLTLNGHTEQHDTYSLQQNKVWIRFFFCLLAWIFSGTNLSLCCFSIDRERDDEEGRNPSSASSSRSYRRLFFFRLFFVMYRRIICDRTRFVLAVVVVVCGPYVIWGWNTPKFQQIQRYDHSTSRHVQSASFPTRKKKVRLDKCYTHATWNMTCCCELRWWQTTFSIIIIINITLIIVILGK